MKPLNSGHSVNNLCTGKGPLFRDSTVILRLLKLYLIEFLHYTHCKEEEAEENDDDDDDDERAVFLAASTKSSSSVSGGKLSKDTPSATT